MSSHNVDELLARQLSLRYGAEYEDGDDGGVLINMGDEDDFERFLHTLDTEESRQVESAQHESKVNSLHQTESQTLPNHDHDLALMLSGEDRPMGLNASMQEAHHEHIFNRYNNAGIETLPTSRKGRGQYIYVSPPPNYEEASTSADALFAPSPDTADSFGPPEYTKTRPIVAIPQHRSKKLESLFSGSSASRQDGSVFVHTFNPGTLQALMDHLCFPDIFALGLTCQAIYAHVAPRLPLEKKQYAQALRYIGDRLDWEAAFCGVCLFLLAPVSLKLGAPKTEQGLRICMQCQDLRLAKGKMAAAEEEGGEAVDGVNCLPVWRRSQRHYQTWRGVQIWWRNASGEMPQSTS